MTAERRRRARVRAYQSPIGWCVEVYDADDLRWDAPPVFREYRAKPPTWKDRQGLARHVAIGAELVK